MRKSGIIFFLLFCVMISAQIKKDTVIDLSRITMDRTADTLKTPEAVVQEVERINEKTEVKPLISPTKAGLYSAILPGLGQMYNRKYWKIPLVWGAVGTGVGIAVWNQHQYDRYRKAFIASLNGQEHEFSDIPGVDSTVLGNIQEKSKRQRDYAIAISAVIYILNIVDAVVDAHLAPMKNDPDLAVAPVMIQDGTGLRKGTAGLSLTWSFR